MRGLVVLFSDARGWSSVSDDTAAALARDGALVVGVDLPTYLQRLDTHTGETCHGLVGDVEAISRQLQRERGNTSYRTPIVAGIGEGGALAPIILAQAPAATIAGAVSYDPTVSVRSRIPMLGLGYFGGAGGWLCVWTLALAPRLLDGRVSGRSRYSRASAHHRVEGSWDANQHFELRRQRCRNARGAVAPAPRAGRDGAHGGHRQHSSCRAACEAPRTSPGDRSLRRWRLA